MSSLTPRERFRQSVQHDEASGSGGPDWSMTFADTMSLLMGFFVLLISFSTFDPTQFQVIAGGVQAKFGGDPPPEPAPQPATRRPGEAGSAPLSMPAPEPVALLRGSIEAWNRQAGGSMNLRVHETYRGVEMTLPADRLFVNGSDQVAPHAEGLLTFVAESLRQTARSRRLVVEVPIEAGASLAPQFEDAWSLAMSRGVAVRAALGQRGRVPGHRIVPAAVGRGSTGNGAPVTFVFEVPEVRPR